jgi:predicted NUDIX family NTP pyrophosphohydrolase
MGKKSAGLLLYRWRGQELQVLLAHMGGPFWKNKDEGAWTLPKGEYEGEEPLEAAQREFQEETGFALPPGPYLPLAPIKQSGGKTVLAFAAEGDCDPARLESNTFEMEWPPKSGRRQSFPEVDRAAWLPLEAAKRKILKSQRPLLEELEQQL